MSRINFVLHLHDAYYWDYIYKSNYVHCFAANELDDALQSLDILSHYNKTGTDKEDFLPIRNIVSAMLGKENNESTSFNLNLLTEEEFTAAENIMKFCLKWRYYPWSIDKCLSAEALGEFYYKEQKLPLIPAVLNFDMDTVGISIILKALKAENFDSLTKDFKEKAIQEIEIAKNYLEKHIQIAFNNIPNLTNINQAQLSPWGKVARQYAIENKKNSAITLEEKRYKHLIAIYKVLLMEYNESKIPNTLSQQYAMLHKQLDDPLYTGSRDIWSRIYGLMLWEAYNELALEQGVLDMTAEEFKKNLVNLRTKDLYDKLKGRKGLSVDKSKRARKNLETILSENHASTETFLDKMLRADHKPAKQMVGERAVQRWFKATYMSINQGSFWVATKTKK